MAIDAAFIQHAVALPFPFSIFELRPCHVYAMSRCKQLDQMMLHWEVIGTDRHPLLPDWDGTTYESFRPLFTSLILLA